MTFILSFILVLSFYFNLKQARTLIKINRLRQADFKSRKEVTPTYKVSSLIQRAYNDHYQI